MPEYLQPPVEANPSALLIQYNEYMEAAFPGWTPSPGQLDARIGGAVSQIAAQVAQAAGDGATNFFRFFGANVVNLPPREAAYSTGVATFTATDALGHTIPAGTTAIWLDGLGNRWGFEATEAAIILVGNTSVVGVPMRACIVGPGADNLSGAAVEVATTPPLAFVSAVTMASPTNGGAEAESDNAYLNRLVEEGKTLTPAPIVPADFNVLLTAHSNVGRATTLRGFNPTATTTHAGTTATTVKEITGLTTAITEQLVVGSAVSGGNLAAGTVVTSVGSGVVGISILPTKAETATCTFTGLLKSAGYVASYVGSPTGTVLTAPEMALLETELEEQTLSGVVAKVLAPTVTAVNVAATVYAWPGQNIETIKVSVEAAIAAYFNPENWGRPPTGQSKEWNNDPVARIVNCEHAILQIVGTHYVASLTFDGGTENVVLPGVVALPKLGTIAVTINLG